MIRCAPSHQVDGHFWVSVNQLVLHTELILIVVRTGIQSILNSCPRWLFFGEIITSQNPDSASCAPEAMTHFDTLRAISGGPS